MNVMPTRLQPASRWRLGGAIASRVIAVVGLGYFCTAAGVALLAALLPAAFGVARGDAVVLAAMSGFLLYLAILLWGFTTPRVWRLWVILATATVSCSTLAQWLAIRATEAG